MGKNISYLLLLYNKNTEKRNLLQLKCKRFLKLMTLRFYAVFRNKKYRKYHKKRYSNTVRVAELLGLAGLLQS